MDSLVATIRLEQQWGFGSIHVLNAHENGYENRIWVFIKSW